MKKLIAGIFIMMLTASCAVKQPEPVRITWEIRPGEVGSESVVWYSHPSVSQYKKYTPDAWGKTAIPLEFIHEKNNTMLFRIARKDFLPEDEFLTIRLLIPQLGYDKYLPHELNKETGAIEFSQEWPVYFTILPAGAKIDATFELASLEKDRYLCPDCGPMLYFKKEERLMKFQIRYVQPNASCSGTDDKASTVIGVSDYEYRKIYCRLKNMSSSQRKQMLAQMQGVRAVTITGDYKKYFKVYHEILQQMK